MAAEGTELLRTIRHTPQRQWGRDRMAAEGRARPAAQRRDFGVNGAATGWPRKGCATGGLARLPLRVNGAATGWPRKARRQALYSRTVCSVNGAATGWPRKV